MGKGISMFFWFLVFIFFVALVGLGIYGYVLDYKYERAIGAYLENARDTITPEAFKEQLLLFKQAVVDTGLIEADYGAMWFEKPDNSMKFQTQHIDSIIGRADAMIQWQEASYNTTSQPIYASPEAFRDVYNEKMNNLRKYIHAEGYRSDWIAEDAWYVKNHPIMYFSGWLYGLLIILMILFGIIGAATWEI